MNGAPTVLAVVGLAGTGKSEVTRLLVAEHGYVPVYFGGVIVDLVAAEGLPATPHNERVVRERLREQEGMEAVARRSLPAITGHLSAGRHVVVDGLYSYAELELLRANVAAPLSTLAVHASRAIRKQRLGRRPVRQLSAAEVDERDLREVQALDKARPIVLADQHLVNDGPLSELAVAVRRLRGALPMQRGPAGVTG